MLYELKLKLNEKISFREKTENNTFAQMRNSHIVIRLTVGITPWQPSIIGVGDDVDAPTITTRPGSR